MNTMLMAAGILGAVGASGATILYFIGQKFKVYEDPRIEPVEDALPGVNCGACGYPGCSSFAKACVEAEDLEDLNCPVGGAETMGKVADVLGLKASKVAKKIAVVRCNGTCENRPRKNVYDGGTSCAIAAQLYGGDTDCSFGCYGLGDCEMVCPFDAIHINPETLIPEVDEEKCTACNKCVVACPKNIIELRKQGPRSRRIYVSCVNEDKGAAARRACNVACIGCSKCVKECPFDAITMVNNLAYIDDDKCRLCRKCVPVCPTGSILELNFPPPRERKPKVEKATADA